MEHVPVQGGERHRSTQKSKGHTRTVRALGCKRATTPRLWTKLGSLPGLWKGGVPKAGGLVPKAGPATHYLMAEGRIAATMDDGAE